MEADDDGSAAGNEGLLVILGLRSYYNSSINFSLNCWIMQPGL